MDDPPPQSEWGQTWTDTLKWGAAVATHSTLKAANYVARSWDENMSVEG
jgi:hypothetical protein